MAESTDLPVCVTHGLLQALQVVHHVVLQVWEDLPGVSLLQRNHNSEGGQRKRRWQSKALLLSARWTLQKVRSAHQL